MSRKRGFTIIEVVLVLAIAGLIFMMVFIALPALQRNQRNEARRESLNRVYALIPQYQKNNNGKLPFNATTGDFDPKFITHYIDDQCKGESEAEVPGASNGGWEFQSCGAQFSDPDGNPFIVGHLKAEDVGSDAFRQSELNHVIYFGSGMICRGEDNVSEDATVDNSPNSYVVMMILEGGSVYCVDNATLPSN